MAVVYWIHLEGQTDITTEGYIGVSSKNSLRRFHEHKRDTLKGSAYTVHRAMRKHGDAIVLVDLVEGSVEYCYEVELKLRPSPNIGWNIKAGGLIAPRQGKKHTPEALAKMRSSSPRKGVSRPMSDATKAKLSKSKTGHQHSESTKQSMRKPKKGSPWDRYNANKGMWALAQDVYLAFMSSYISINSGYITREFGISKKTAENILKKLLLGWIPCEDEAWLDFKNNRGIHAHG